MDQYEFLKVRQNKYFCFNLFEVWFLIFSLKDKIMRNIDNRNVAELAHRIIVF